MKLNNKQLYDENINLKNKIKEFENNQNDTLNEKITEIDDLKKLLKQQNQTIL